MLTLIAAVACGAGVLCLRVFWRRSHAWKAAGILLGWSLVVAGTVIWSAASGPEFGTSFALLTTALAAWLLIAASARSRPRVTARPYPRSMELGRTSRRHKLATFMAGGPVAGLATALAVVLLVRLLPISSGGQMVTAAFAYPLAWGCAVVWVCMRARPRGALFLLTLLAVCSAAGLWFAHLR